MLVFCYVPVSLAPRVRRGCWLLGCGLLRVLVGSGRLFFRRCSLVDSVRAHSDTLQIRPPQRWRRPSPQRQLRSGCRPLGHRPAVLVHTPDAANRKCSRHARSPSPGPEPGASTRPSEQRSAHNRRRPSRVVRVQHRRVSSETRASSEHVACDRRVACHFHLAYRGEDRASWRGRVQSHLPDRGRLRWDVPWGAAGRERAGRASAG